MFASVGELDIEAEILDQGTAARRVSMVGCSLNIWDSWSVDKDPRAIDPGNPY